MLPFDGRSTGDGLAFAPDRMTRTRLDGTHLTPRWTGLVDAGARDDGWIAPEKQLSCERPFKVLVLVRPITLDPGRRTMQPHASFVGADLVDHLALNSAGAAAFPRLIRERITGLSYRRIRGSPKSG